MWNFVNLRSMDGGLFCALIVFFCADRDLFRAVAVCFRADRHSFRAVGTLFCADTLAKQAKRRGDLPLA